MVAPLPPRDLPKRQGRGRGFLPRVGERTLPVACKPGSVPAPGFPDAGEDHSSRRPIAGTLQRPDPRAGDRHPPAASDGPSSSARLFELAPGGACPAAGCPAVARGLLPHDFTLACASPVIRLSDGPPDRGPSAVSFLLRFPSGFPGSPLTTSLPCGARTFLPRAVIARRRSSGHLQRGRTLPENPCWVGMWGGRSTRLSVSFEY